MCSSTATCPCTVMCSIFKRNKILICILFFKSLERVLSISDQECIKVCRSTTYQAKVIERLFLINNINPKKIRIKMCLLRLKYMFLLLQKKYNSSFLNVHIFLVFKEDTSPEELSNLATNLIIYISLQPIGLHH